MRGRTSLAILATVSTLTVIGSIDPAAAQDTFCLQGRQWGYPGNCQFSSYAQCAAAASGTDAYCGVNPLRAYARQPRERYRDRSYEGYRDRY